MFNGEDLPNLLVNVLQKWNNFKAFLWQNKCSKSTINTANNKQCPYSEFYEFSYFTAFGLNTEINGVNLRIKFKCGKIKTRKISNTGTFHAAKDSAMTLHRLQFLYC